MIVRYVEATYEVVKICNLFLEGLVLEGLLLNCNRLLTHCTIISYTRQQQNLAAPYTGTRSCKFYTYFIIRLDADLDKWLLNMLKAYIVGCQNNIL